jgi:hypothetical protein
MVEALANFMPVFAGLLCFWLYDLVYPDEALSIASIYSLLTIFSSIVYPIKSLIDSFQARLTQKVGDVRYDEIVNFEQY